jgi:hypothetical protein
MKPILLLLLLAAPAIICAPQSVNNPCKLPPDLFNRRAVLQKKYDSAARAYTASDEILARRKTVDERYYQFMVALANDAQQQRLAELKTCCGQNMRDPIARLMCGLAFYHTEQSAAKEFVEQFQVSGNMDPLWSLDEIALISGEMHSMLPLFGHEGPVYSYTDELMTLITKGNKQALQKYLQLYLRATGVHADGMADQVKGLFSEHPEFVLNNWNVLKKNKFVIPNLQNSLSDDEKRQMRQNYERYCHINQTACREVIRALR